ncbi:MAG TPA: stage II sporulation protein M [Candidatus Omnitrophota bacterium]|nr:stage II sporulation protein M [Candidatus Omnitrophota bacterium]
MFESLINPKKAERKPWEMFFVGLIYATLSILLVKWFFSGNDILSNYSGILIVTFCVMFSLPFMYFMIRREEKEDENIENFRDVWRVHNDAIFAFMWLFLGFLVAFSFWYILLQDTSLFNAQIGTYCQINSPGNIQGCMSQYISGQAATSADISSGTLRFFSILENNLLVMIFTLIFSLIFGAGAIFVLAWNASVISASIGIFTKYSLAEIPLGLARYMIHGFPEIAAYFVAALAGGIFGVGIARHGIKDRRFLKVGQHAAVLIGIAIFLLVIAGLMEVYLTPLLFQ